MSGSAARPPAPRALAGRLAVLLGLSPVASTRRLGRRGERLAARTLRRRGYRVLARNVRVPVGEADLVCLDPDGRTLVIVEVKTRAIGAGPGAAPPEANIHAHKRRKLLAVARSLAKMNGWTHRPLRIDVVAIEWPRGEGGGAARTRPDVRHYINAVTPRG